MRHIQRLLGLVLCAAALSTSAAAQTVAQGAPGTLPWKINLFSGTTIVPLPTALGSDGGWKINWADAGVIHTIVDSGNINTVSIVSTIANPLPSGTNVLGHVIVDTAPSTAVTGPITDTQLRATPVPVSGTFWQTTQPVSQTTLPPLVAGSALIGHVIADTGSTTAVTGNVAITAAALPLPAGAATAALQGSTVVTGNVAVTSAGLTNLDVALSTRTKPADQQHTIVDSGTVTAVTAITNALPAGSNVIGHVIQDTGSTTAVTGSVAVTSTGLTNLDIALSALRDALVGVSARTLTDAYTQLATIITNQQNEQAILGTTTLPTRLVLVGGVTTDSPPQVQPLPLAYNGAAVRTVTTPFAPRLPLPPCNPVRQTNCQAKGF